MKLTPKQKAFADAYIETGNASEAIRRAGYDSKNPNNMGSEYLAKPSIAAYIRERMQPTIEKRIATADDVLMFLTKGMNGEIKDQFGLDASFQDRISCAKELLKRFSAVQERAEQTEAKIIISADGGIEVDDGT